MTDRAETKRSTEPPPSGTKALDRLGREHRRGPRGRFVKTRTATPSPASALLAADKALLLGIDARSRNFGRFYEIVSAHLSDLGGESNTSAAERSIIRRIGALTVQLEALESKFDTPGASDKGDVDLYIRGAGGLRRLLQSIGLERRSKDVSPSLDRYLKKLAIEKQERLEREAAEGDADG